MSRALPYLAVLTTALCACQSHPAAQTRSAAAGSARTGETGAAQPGPALAKVGAPAHPAPAIRVAGTSTPGGVAISVQNRAEAPVQLASELQLERRTQQGFESLSAERLVLDEKQLQGCVALAPGAELRPSPWRSAKTEPARGLYRFVVHACDRTYRIEGEPFELP